MPCKRCFMPPPAGVFCSRQQVSYFPASSTTMPRISRCLMPCRGKQVLYAPCRYIMSSDRCLIPPSAGVSCPVSRCLMPPSAGVSWPCLARYRHFNSAATAVQQQHVGAADGRTLCRNSCSSVAVTRGHQLTAGHAVVTAVAVQQQHVASRRLLDSCRNSCSSAASTREQAQEVNVNWDNVRGWRRRST